MLRWKLSNETSSVGAATKELFGHTHGQPVNKMEWVQNRRDTCEMKSYRIWKNCAQQVQTCSRHHFSLCAVEGQWYRYINLHIYYNIIYVHMYVSMYIFLGGHCSVSSQNVLWANWRAIPWPMNHKLRNFNPHGVFFFCDKKMGKPIYMYIYFFGPLFCFFPSFVGELTCKSMTDESYPSICIFIFLGHCSVSSQNVLWANWFANPWPMNHKPRNFQPHSVFFFCDNFFWVNPCKSHEFEFMFGHNSNFSCSLPARSVQGFAMWMAWGVVSDQFQVILIHIFSCLQQIMTVCKI